MRNLWKVGAVVVSLTMVSLSGTLTARGEDAFYRMSLKYLIKPAGARLHEPDPDQWNSLGYLRAPRVCVDVPGDGDAEAYVLYPHGAWSSASWYGSRFSVAKRENVWDDVYIVFRAPAGEGESRR